MSNYIVDERVVRPTSISYKLALFQKGDTKFSTSVAHARVIEVVGC